MSGACGAMLVHPVMCSDAGRGAWKPKLRLFTAGFPRVGPVASDQDEPRGWPHSLTHPPCIPRFCHTPQPEGVKS